MQQEYTAPAGGTSLFRRYPLIATCPICGRPFKPCKDRKRFCGKACYLKWVEGYMQERAEARGGKPRRGKSVPAYPEEASSDCSILAAPPLTDDLPDDDALWVLRASYWQDETDTATIGAMKAHRRGNPRAKDRLRLPLVLTGHGVTIRIDKGTLFIRDGFTHYPQERKEYRFFRGDRNLPARIMLLDTDGSVSFDVLAWLSQQSVPLVMLNWQGEVVSLFGGDGVAADVRLRQALLAAKENGIGLEVSAQMIAGKIEGCRDTLLTLPVSHARDSAIYWQEEALQELRAGVGNLDTVRLIEGRAALAYFNAWQSLQLRWKGTSRKPIPPEWLFVGQRESLLSGTNKHAVHPMNALLNYAYGVLESQVRMAAVAAGFDPTIGFLHACRPGRVALVYDLMEPLRPVVDRMLLQFVRSESFTGSDFLLTERGICRLHPQLARRVAMTGVSNAEIDQPIHRLRDMLFAEQKPTGVAV